ncbi:Protein of unknown function [Paenibacillus sp. UNC496MF]|uniref:contractile injection system sheath initiator n=1 Tax=Paenibacillus sp. UNC496MF TaxID=1502753 RepID=UPI0008E9AB8D|nr:DUF2634 domain-containing protein [Paenibacillus sp. UNC496MF]SFJ44473.1 Protein of unknown function [Paenibacillus sp. UNC496MF]
MFSLKVSGGDLVLENGDFATVTDKEELAQSAEILLGTNQGEWFLDPEMGLNFSALTGKAVEDETAAEAIRAALQQEPRIQGVESIAFARNQRQLTATIVITSEMGSTEVSTSGN